MNVLLNVLRTMYTSSTEPSEQVPKGVIGIGPGTARRMLPALATSTSLALETTLFTSYTDSSKSSGVLVYFGADLLTISRWSLR